MKTPFSNNPASRIWESRDRVFRGIRILALFGVLISALLGVSTNASADMPEPKAEGYVLLVGASLIDGTGANVKRNAWLSIRDDRIVTVGLGKPPEVEGGRYVDLKGKTLMPGLTDMHVHFNELPMARWMMKALLVHGITTAMDASNSLGNIAEIKRWMEWQKSLPHVFFSSPTVQGSYSEQRFLQPGAQIEGLMADYGAFGVEFVKTYNWLSSSGLKQVSELAGKHGLRITGHTPLSASSVASIDAGIEILQHLRLRPYEVIDDAEVLARFPIDAPLMKRTGYWAYFDDQAGSLRRTLDAWEQRKDRFFVVPTLVVQEAIAENYDYPKVDHSQHAHMQQISPGMLEYFKVNSPPTYFGNLSDEEIERAKRSVDGMAQFVKMAHRRGIRLLSGTDTPIPWLVAGKSLHRELYHFVEKCGMTPEQAIRTSTGWAADALNVADRGRVAPGQVADLVIVDGDVAENIRALEHIHSVVLAGVIHSRQQLLDAANEWADRHPAQQQVLE